jgi:two-component system, cell cycle response regulator DivK
MSTILFVEDQFELRAVHTAYLQSHGFNVITAESGEAGLELARTTHPDVMVLDHSLPRRTGVEIATLMQDDPDLSGIPIVMMTAVPFGAIGKRAMAAGCKAFLAKPCSPSRLLQEVKRFT